MFKSHLLLIATTLVLGTAACSTEVEVETTADELSSKDIARFNDKDCKKEKDKVLGKIAKKSKSAIEDALKAIGNQKPSKDADLRKKDSCFVVTNAESKPSIVSIHTSGVAAKGACGSVASVLKGATCNQNDVRVYEVPAKLCDKDHIYAAGTNKQKSWVYDEYNSSISARDTKLLISECGQASQAFEDSDD